MKSKFQMLLLISSTLFSSNVLVETTDFAEEVKETEKEVKATEPVENVERTEEIREHLNQFYNEICSPAMIVTYRSYFTTNVRLNNSGKRLEGQKGVTQVFTDLNPDSCHIDDFKVWDIEVHDDTAIALVIGHADVQQSKHLSWVEAHELIKIKDEWKTDIKLLFIDVNFHDKEPQNDEGVIAEIKDYLNGYFLATCTKTESLTDIAAFFSNEIQSNIAGKKFSGMKGLSDIMSDMPGSTCKVRSYSIVKVETYGERAIALIKGHGDLNEKEHPYVEVFELVKQPIFGWRIDTLLDFVDVTMPQHGST